MKLSKKTEYGIRAMVRLATRHASERVRMQQLAAEEGLPPQFMSTIMTLLQKHKFVQSKRGMDGGFSLSRPPREILVANLIGCLEAGPAFRAPSRRSSASDTVELVHDLERLITRHLGAAMDGLTLAELVRLAAVRQQENASPTYQI